MLINFEKKFIYIRPHKVGSTSFMHFLTNNQDSSKFVNYQYFRFNGKIAYYKDGAALDRLGYAHAPLKLIKQTVSEELFNSYSKVSSIRNPYTQTVSLFLFHKLRLTRLLANKQFANLLIQKPKAALRLVVLSSELKFLWYEYLKKLTPYSTYIESDGKLICDDYIRVENYDEDLKSFCSKYGYVYQNNKKLNVNKRSSKEAYERFLDKKSIDIIKSKFKNIFDRFDYQPPNS